MKEPNARFINWTIVGIVLIIFLIAIGKAFSFDPYPPPDPNDVNDIPFPWDPNLCPSPAYDWMVVEPGSVWSYTFDVVSKWGTKADGKVSESGATIQWIGRVHKEQPQEHWRQYFEVLWSPFIEGIHYVEIIVTDKAGRQDRRTIVILVANDPPLIYPHDEQVLINPVAWSQQVVQRARCEKKYPPTVADTVLKIVHRWD